VLHADREIANSFWRMVFGRQDLREDPDDRDALSMTAREFSRAAG
jgi:hypothetical protein